jgi:Kef-type K+ transport system membrane component KefB
MTNPIFETTSHLLQFGQYSKLFYELALIAAVTWPLTWLCRRLRQPIVIGEIVAGILLGPTIIGGWATHIFPAPQQLQLSAMAQIGVVLFMFMMGLDVDLEGHWRSKLRGRSATIALTGTAIPFLLGIVAAFALYTTTHGVRLLPFALFVGISVSVTAFPVLGRILTDSNLRDKPVGVLALAVSAQSDLLCWAMLIVILAIDVSASVGQSLLKLVLVAVMVGLIIGPVRWWLKRFENKALLPGGILLVLGGIFLCAGTSTALEVQGIFGAFLLGAALPKGQLAEQTRTFVTPIAALLLPIFFVITGLSVNLRTIASDGWWPVVLILVVACAGKVGGVIGGARLTGLPYRDGLGLGVLMNTRGLTELVVLTIGLHDGILNTQLFSAFVLMAVLTTVMTGPLLRWVKPDPFMGSPALAEDRSTMNPAQ